MAVTNIEALVIVTSIASLIFIAGLIFAAILVFSIITNWGKKDSFISASKEELRDPHPVAADDHQSAF